VTVDKSVDKFCAKKDGTDIELRLKSLESEIKDLKSLLLLNESDNLAENRKQKAEGEIRTRVVASTGRLFEYKLQNGLIGPEYPHSMSGVSSPAASEDACNCRTSNSENLATLILHYSKKELKNYTEFRVAGISKASIPWMKRCSLTFWNVTNGTISKERCDALRKNLSTRYTDVYAPRKVLNFATAFLKYLAKTHFDTRYQAFDLFLEMPKGLKTRKHVTNRIVTEQDVENVLSAIERTYQNGEIDAEHRLHYRAIVLFSAFAGQRTQATTTRLTVDQFRTAVNQKKPVIDVLPQQDKIRMQHYCALQTALIRTVAEAAEDPAFAVRCTFCTRRSAKIL
jgi:hypothetical protein